MDGNSIETELQLKNLLKDSLSRDSFYNKVSEILNIASLVCGGIGLIPGIGIPFSVASLGETALSTKLKNNKYNWYQLIYSMENVNKNSIIKNL